MKDAILIESHGVAGSVDYKALNYRRRNVATMKGKVPNKT